MHPPFRWQQPYAEEFAEGIRRLNQESDIRFAVENMYPWRASTPDLFGKLPGIRVPKVEREGEAYFPGWDPTEAGFEHYTLDLSHTATARNDAWAMFSRMGDSLAHLHLADGTGLNKDEHLVPGRGSQPCREVLEAIAGRGLAGVGRGRGEHPARDGRPPARGGPAGVTAVRAAAPGARRAPGSPVEQWSVPRAE